MRSLDVLAPLLDAQHGAVTRRQCLDAGLSASTVRTLVSSGRWQRLHRGVFVSSSGAVTDDARVSAALLAVGPAAVVSHGTALWAVRRRGPLSRPVHLAVPVLCPAEPPAGVRLHRLERLEAEGSDPPRMPCARAVLEIAHLAGSSGEVVGLVCDAVRDGLTTHARLIEELAARPRQRWRALLVDLLADVEAGVRSPLERLDALNDRAHGLPQGERQVSHRAGGRSRWLDVVVRAPGLVLVKELDGRLGHEGRGRFRDLARDNVTVLAGAPTLRLGWADLHPRGCEAAAGQALLWERLGLRGPVGRSCRRPGCDLHRRVARLRQAVPALTTAPTTALVAAAAGA